MGDLSKYCRIYTALTSMQIELLKRISVSFPLLADITRACIHLYVQSQDGRCFILVAKEHPCTVYLPGMEKEVGAYINVQEEPLLCKTLEGGKLLQGKREWYYGKMRNMYTIPISEGGRVLAIVSLESEEGQFRGDEHAHIMRTAGILLEHARRTLEPERYRHISSSDGILIADKYRRIIYADAAAVRIYRVLGVGNLLGCHLMDRQLLRHITKESVESSRPWEKELEAGGLVLLQRDLPIMEGGSLVGQIVVLSDVTEIRKKDRELQIKSAVIQEIHHRVKNNLQMAASLLRLQARRSSSREVKEALQESVDRLLSLSVVHEFLSQQGKEEIDVAEVMRSIFELVAGNMKDKDFCLQTELCGSPIILPSRYASSLALVLNELVLNAMEHAFAGRSKGTIGLMMETGNKYYLLDLHDDGNGLPPDFHLSQCRSLGLQIVQTLVEGDMGGTFRLVNENGTHGKIMIPRKKGMERDA